jgi:rubrerythrin
MGKELIMRMSLEEMAAAKGLSRRNFIKAVAAGTVAVGAMGVLGACSKPSDGGSKTSGTAGGHEGESYGNLNTAINGETNAYTKYEAFADAADAEGYAQVAKLFRATAGAERIHAGDEFDLAFAMDASSQEATPNKPEPGTTAENLQAAIDGETYEYSEMYPAFLKAAQEEKLEAAAAIFARAMKAEECHAKNYQSYLDNLDKVEEADIYLCPTCGYIKIGDNSGSCPVCMVSCAAFKKF